MGVVTEPVLAPEAAGKPEVAEKPLVQAPTVAETEFAELVKVYCGEKGTKGISEVEIDVGLNLIQLYGGVYEEGRLTNQIINVAKPWEVRLHWRLVGCLRELICGKWCVKVHFESIGTGNEFELGLQPDLHFDCHDKYFNVVIPGRELHPDECSTPYKVVATVIYESLCGKPGP